MHGRLKIKTTVEQEEEKRKEREIKQKKYLKGLHLVFTKRKENIYDKEALQVTANLLIANPDALSLWNYRREIFLNFKDELKDEAEWQKLLEDELQDTEHCLLKNPKSYGAWHHRGWIFQVIPNPSYQEELELCDRYLQKDERNFHCWDHRRIIVKLSGRSLLEELTFTQELIDKNFSNYSAWHYRSKLLPLLYPPPEGSSHPVPEEILMKELKKVVTAVFTDPSDQSPWFFLHWLLSSKAEQPRLLQVGLIPFDEGVELILVFSRENISSQGLSIFVNEEELCSEFLKPYRNACLWSAVFPLHENTYKIELKNENLGIDFTLEGELKDLPVFQRISEDLLGKKELSDPTKQTFHDILNNCLTLNEVDPGNKWVLLTLVNLMTALDASSHLDKIWSYLDELQRIDPLRIHYYEDLRSKIVIEEKLQASGKESRTFEAAHLQLTRITSSHCLSSFEKIDLRGNSLRNAATALSCFLNCVQLILDGNPVNDVKPLLQLKRLSELSLNSCGVTSLKVIDDLSNIKTLTHLSLKDNQVCNEENFEQIVRNVIQTLKELSF